MFLNDLRWAEFEEQFQADKDNDEIVNLPNANQKVRQQISR
jgi:hypothetical protein